MPTADQFAAEPERYLGEQQCFYEIWVQPDSGPLTVSERGFNNEIGFLDKAEAIETAKRKKRQYPYPSLHFLVREEIGDHGPCSIVYRTRDDPEFTE